MKLEVGGMGRWHAAKPVNKKWIYKQNLSICAYTHININVVFQQRNNIGWAWAANPNIFVFKLLLRV